jgi:cardiolipin synthase
MDLSGVMAGARRELGLMASSDSIVFGRAARQVDAQIAASPVAHLDLPPAEHDAVLAKMETLGQKWRPNAYLLAGIANGTAQLPDGIAHAAQLQTLAHDALVTTFVEGALHGRAAMSRAPRVTGNTAQLLMRDEEYLPRLWHDIRNAQKSVTITMYNIENAGSGRQLLDELAALKRRRPDIDIRLVLDAHGTAEPGRERGKQLLQELDQLEIPYAVSSSPLLPHGGGWEHRKIVVIDDRIAYEGGLGFAGTDAGKYGTWMDSMVRMEGPVGAVAAVHSLAMWRDLTGRIDQRAYTRLFDAQEALLGHRQLTPGPEALSPETLGFTAEAGPPVPDAAITLMENRPGSDLPITEQLLRDARAAGPGDELWGTSSYLTTRIIGDELEHAAERGADTRLVVSSLTGENDTMQIRIGRSFYRPMLESGMRLFQWENRMMHAKSWMLRTPEGAVTNQGSFNFSRMSIRSRDSTARIEGAEYAARYRRFHEILQTSHDPVRYSTGTAHELGPGDTGTIWSDHVVGAVRRVVPDAGF